MELAETGGAGSAGTDDLRAMIDAVPGMIGYWDVNLINVHANSAYATFFGKSPNQIRGRHISELLGPDLYQKNLPYLLAALAGQTQSFERAIPRPDGQGVKQSLATYVPHLRGGRVAGIVVLVTDVTEIKMSQIRAVESREFCIRVLNSMGEGFVIQDSSGRIMQFNDAATRILCMTADELIGRTSIDPRWRAFKEDGSPFPGEEHPSMLTIRTGKPQSNVVMGVRVAEGATRWIKINSVPIESDVNGHPAAVLATFSDITEEVEKRKILSNVVRNSPGVICRFKLDDPGLPMLTFVSSKVHDLFEIEPAELARDSKAMFRMILDEDRSSLLGAIRASARDLAPLEWAGRIQAKSGTIKWISARCLPIREASGETIWDGILMDVTEQVRTQEQLVAERARAAHAAKLASLGELSAGVAHEINNPLAIISGMTKTMLSNLEEPQKLVAKMDSIEKAVARISRIVNGLRRFSRSSPEVGRVSRPLCSVLRDVAPLIEIKSERHATDVRWEFESEGWVKCDPAEIEQVMINLINNGIDAVKDLESRWVHVRLFERGDRVVIRVADSGSGISAKVTDRLFDPFFTTKPVGEGTGLGLSISRAIIEDHGGRIFVDQTAGNTCFEIDLPRAAKVETSGGGHAD